MKVAIISPNLKAQAGGNRQILELARHLKNAGHQAVIYTPSVSADSFSHLQKELDIRVVPPVGELDWHKNPKGLFAKVRHKLAHRRAQIETQKRIAEAMDADFDVVNPHDWAYHIMRFYKQRNPRVRTVFMMCEPQYMYLPKKGFLRDMASRAYNAFLDMTEGKYLRAADAAGVLAPAEKEWLETRGVKNVAIVLSGLDFNAFYAPARKHPGKNAEFRLLAVGIPNVYRRYADMILAADILRKKGYKIRFDIVAKNVWGDDEYCAGLAKLVKEKGLEQYVKIYFDGVSEKELKNLYANDHIFIHTTYVPPGHNGASWALVVNEAQAAGMPVVLYKNTGAAEVLTDGVNAMLAETCNPEDLAAKIAKLIDDPALYERIAREGQKFVKENISWEKYTEKMLKLFQG